MPTANRTVPEGSLVLLSGGRDEDVYIAALFRAVTDLDLDALTARYLSTVPSGRENFKAPELPPVAFGANPGPAYPLERGFTEWLVAGGHVERLPTHEVYLDGGFARNGSPYLTARIETAPPEDEPSQGGPRF